MYTIKKCKITVINHKKQGERDLLLEKIWKKFFFFSAGLKTK